MRFNPFYDTWEFLLGRTNDHMLAGPFVAWLLTLGFLALLAAGAWIAWQEWHEDPVQRTSANIYTWAMRTLIGCMWFQGSLWKLPLPVSGGLSYWTQQMAEHAAFSAHAWLVTHILLPGLAFFNPLVYLIELGLAVSLILGILVRPFCRYRHPVRRKPLAGTLSPSRRMALDVYLPDFHAGLFHLEQRGQEPRSRWPDGAQARCAAGGE